MYPSLSSIGRPPGSYREPDGGASAGAAASGSGRIALQSAASAEASPWSADSHSVLRVKIADEYRLDPLVTVPPALEAGSRSQARDFDFEYERGVMQSEGGGLVDRFLGKPEDTYYAGTRVGKYVSMGYPATTVQLALAYQASTRGDEACIVDFCNNLTQLIGMGFTTAVAAGALVRARNDATAAADLCLASAA